MLDPGERKALTKEFRSIRLVWAAILGSLLFYLLICRLWGDEIRGHTSPDFPVALLRKVLYVVAVVELIVAYFLRKFLLKNQFIGLGSNRLLRHDGARANRPLHVIRYTTAVIISVAMANSIGIYGLILFLLGDEVQSLYVFIAVSALAMYYFRPKMEEFEQLAASMKSESGYQGMASGRGR
jgi:hypothetical protein